MPTPTVGIGFSASTPAPPDGFQVAKPQDDGGQPLRKFDFVTPNTGGVSVKTGNYTAVAGDCGKLISFEDSSPVAAHTLTLPATPPFAQWTIGVENIGTGVLTIARNGLLIDTAAANLTLNQNSGFKIYTDGTNYFTERGVTALPSGPANQVVATPDGTSGQSAIRTLVANDIPALPESKITNLTTDLAAKVPTSTTVNGHALSSNVVVSASDITTGTLPPAQLPLASSSAFGAVKVDGSTITAASGVISAVGGGGGGGFGGGIFARTVYTATGSKAFGTVYQNTSSFPMIVIAWDATTSAAATLVTDASNPPTTVWSSLQTIASFAGPIIGVVMPSHFYKLTGVSIGGWNEYLFNTGTFADSGNISGSRALGSTFQNTGSGVMLVSAVITGTTSGNTITVVSDSSATPTTLAYQMTTVTTTNTAFFLVPQSHYYKITVSGGSLSALREISTSITASKSANLITSPNRRVVGLMPSSSPSSASLNQTGKAIFAVFNSSANNTNTMYMSSDNCVFPILQVYGCAIAGTRVRSVSALQMPGDFLMCYFDGAASLSGTNWFEYTLG